MTEGRTDKEILDGSPVVTTLDGVRYVWRQRPRREQRKLRDDLLDITVNMAMINDKKTPDQDRVRFIVSTINDIVDLCDEYGPDDMDGDEVESYVRDNGRDGFQSLINDVYMVLFDAWLKPWMDFGGEETEKKPKPRTRKRKTTKP